MTPDPTGASRKPAISAGCIVIALVIVGFLISGLGLLAVAFYRTEFLRARQGVPTINETPVVGGPAKASPPAADKPSPTPAQTAALEGGATVTWARHGLSWTVPRGWAVQTDDEGSLVVKSPGTDDAAWLNVSLSPLPTTFPYETSLNAMYKQAIAERDSGAYTEATWLELDGVRGIAWREAAPERSSDVQRLQWQAYRPGPNGVDLISVMVHSTGKGFPQHVDELYAVLYSTRLSH